MDMSSFQDEPAAAEGLRSSWRARGPELRDSKGCQTPALHCGEAEVQTASTWDRSTQTEPLDQDRDRDRDQDRDRAAQQPLPPPAPGLEAFLLRVGEGMVRELARNARSHAFHAVQPGPDQGGEQVSLLHHLQHRPAQQDGLQVTAVSWTCSGAVLACAYGRLDDGDWSTRRACVCTWNLDLRDLQPDRAHLVLDTPAAVTALCCHPSQPGLIAGGLYSGEVLVWDSSRTPDPVLAQTGLSPEGHREPVTTVSWVSLQRGGDVGLLSSGSGGRVLLWVLDRDRGSLVLQAAFVLLGRQVPRSGGSVQARGGGAVGVTSLAVSPWDPDCFLVGSEGGLLLRCSLSSRTPAAVPGPGAVLGPAAMPGPDGAVPLRAPAVFSFRPQGGPVHSVHCSPFHRNLFVSGGTDGMARLHSLLQAAPLRSLRVSQSFVFHVQLSPSRPLLLAAATGHGEVLLFDLGLSSERPVAVAAQRGDGGWECGGAAQRGGGGAATCLSFNRRRPELLAAGRSDGSVSVWRLSRRLAQPRPREDEALDDIARRSEH